MVMADESGALLSELARKVAASRASLRGQEVTGGSYVSSLQAPSGTEQEATGGAQKWLQRPFAQVLR